MTLLDPNEFKANRVFVGREELITSCLSRLAERIPTASYSVHMTYGPAGQGKSYVKKQIIKCLSSDGRLKSSPYAEVSFRSMQDPETILFHIRRQLENHGKIRFPIFDVAFAKYNTVRYPNSNDVALNYPSVCRKWVLNSEKTEDSLVLINDAANLFSSGLPVNVDKIFKLLRNED